MEPDSKAVTDRRGLDIHFAGGVAWTAGAKWVTQALTWLSLFLTARILSTGDYGLAEMASYSFLLTNVLAEFGVATAVMQLRGMGPKVLGQLHSFSCLLSSLIFLLLLPLSPLIAQFFDKPQITTLIAWNNIGILFVGLQAVPLGLLQRDMDYRRLSIMEAVQAVVQSVGTVLAAWWGLGYWSLMLGGAAGRLGAVVLLNVWKPVSYVWPTWQDLREPLQFGSQTVVSRLSWSCYTQADGIVVGRVLGESSLGVYRMAMNLAVAPAEKISLLIMRAAGPLFARVKADESLVRRYFVILAETLTMIELPMMLGLGIVAPEVVLLTLGPDWSGVVGPLRWLVLFMTMRTLATLMEQVLIARGQTRFTMHMSLVNLVVMPGALYAGARWWGTDAVAATWVLLAPVTVIPLWWRLSREIGLGVRTTAATLWPGVASVVTMIGVLLLLRPWVDMQPWATGTRLAVLVSVGGLAYGAVLLGCFRERVVRYYRFLKNANG